jgi:FixJ family two-component response regulator
MTASSRIPFRYASEHKDRPCVLVVEDDVALLSALQFALEAEGYDVRTFSNQMQVLSGQDIMSSASCLVIDYKLNPLNGLEVFALLRNRGMKAPAILITTRPDTQCIEEAVRLGVEVVEKPLLTDALSRKIAELIAAHSPH